MANINKHNTHILLDFEYYAPETVREASKLLKEHGSDAVALAGGTDVIVKMKEGTRRPKYIVNLKKIPGLSGIKETSKGIEIGSLTKIREVEKSALIRDEYPILHEAARALGSVQIRNLATIGGNICNASPCADSAVGLLSLDAVAHIEGLEGERDVPLGDFFLGPGRTVLAPGEILTSVKVPKTAPGSKSAFNRVARVSMDLATISLAAVVTMKQGVVENSRLAWGTVAPMPMRTKDVEDFLKGKKLTDEVIEKAAELASKSIKPREKGRSTGPYKRRVAKGFIIETLSKLKES
ncbi:xanthine dehydrogenase family protein subunit M [Candidatus Bathyarchaeota archaeon]|nr:xanthine dehydrogenase family protein subunit M [Candidatus Bathyarchaeota archaeon]